MTISIQELAQRSDIKFRTSGLRGLVVNLTDDVCFAYTKAFLLSQKGTLKRSLLGMIFDHPALKSPKILVNSLLDFIRKIK